MTASTPGTFANSSAMFSRGSPRSCSVLAYAIDTRMGYDDDDIGLLPRSQFRYSRLRALPDQRRRSTPSNSPAFSHVGTAGVVMPMIPTFTPSTVFTIEDCEGFLAALRIRFRVGRKPWKSRVRSSFVQVLQPIIELVIAHCHRVILQMIHREHHGIGGERPSVEFQVQGQFSCRNVAPGKRSRAGSPVSCLRNRQEERTALSSVQRGSVLRSWRVPRRRLSCQVIVREDVAVHVRRRKNRNGHLPAERRLQRLRKAHEVA